MTRAVVRKAQSQLLVIGITAERKPRLLTFPPPFNLGERSFEGAAVVLWMRQRGRSRTSCFRSKRRDPMAGWLSVVGSPPWSQHL